MKRFYELPLGVQWILAMLMFFIGLGYSGWIFSGMIQPLWLNILLFLPAVSIFQFTATPFFKLTGTYQYLSPMLLVFNASKEKHELHSGTSFDLMLHFNFSESGKKAQKKWLAYILEGILTIIEKIENGELPETVTVYGDSYFFSERTAKKLGFKVETTTNFYSFNLWINAIDIFLMYSFTQGKWALPPLKNMKRAITTGDELVKRKAQIEKYVEWLRK